MLSLEFKHRLAHSRWAGIATRLRSLWYTPHLFLKPELALLYREHVMTDILLERIIEKGWSCMDIGAHLGTVSRKLHELTPDGSLTIVEAVKSKADMLRKSFPDATIHECAIANETGQIVFYENLKQSGFSSLNNRTGRGKTREVSVKCRRVDDLIAEDERLDLIKIDIEGGEFDAMLGASEVLTRCRPIILFEAGAAADRDVNQTDSQKLFELLTGEFGYDVFAVFDLYFDRGPISMETFELYRTYPFMAFNFIAIHRDTPANITPSQERRFQ